MLAVTTGLPRLQRRGDERQGRFVSSKQLDDDVHVLAPDHGHRIRHDELAWQAAVHRALDVEIGHGHQFEHPAAGRTDAPVGAAEEAAGHLRADGAHAEDRDTNGSLLGGHGLLDWGQRHRGGTAAEVTDWLCVVSEWYPRRRSLCPKARAGRRLARPPSGTLAAMTTDAAATSVPRAPTLPPKPRAFSGIQPSGVMHLGNDLGAVRNYVALQDRGVAEGFETIYCVVDYHALTHVHDPEILRRQTLEMAASLIALGLDPNKCTLFVQSDRPEVTELCWLFNTVTPVGWLQRTPTYKEKRENQPEDVNHGLLTYPVLQAADIVIYKASLVPVGRDQAAHLELSREIVRAFNARYGETFPEPKAVYTEAPVVLGTDGQRKMSKSLRNTIEVLAEPDLIRKQVMSMVTDTQRILRTDPGRPEVCNVCQMHRFFGDDYEYIWEGERTARTGCVDNKKLLADRIIAHYAPARETYRELTADPARLRRILDEGAERIRPIAQATMVEVRERMGLR